MQKWSEMDTTRKGEIGEREVIVELMKLGIDYFSPVADDKGIDGIIRVEDEKKVKYFDVQIKTLRNSFKSDFNRLRYPEYFTENDKYILILAVTYEDKKPDIYFITKENANMIEKSPDANFKGYINLSKCSSDELERIKIEKLPNFLIKDNVDNGDCG